MSVSATTVVLVVLTVVSACSFQARVGDVAAPSTAFLSTAVSSSSSSSTTTSTKAPAPAVSEPTVSEPTVSEPERADGERGGDDGVAWVFVPSGLTPEFRRAAGAVDGVDRVAQVGVAAVNMVSSADADGRPVDELTDGFKIQLDARSYTPTATLEELAPGAAAAVADLDTDEVLLTEGSAELRRLDVGGRITMESGATYTVAKVVSEDDVGSVEIVFAGADSLETAGAVSIRPGLLVSFDGDVSVLEERLSEANGGSGVRVFGGRRSEDRDLPTPVLSPLEVKQRFGEFSFRPTGGRSVEVDDKWFDENIELRRLPVIGRVRCHRTFNRALNEVMSGLVRDGLEDIIDTSAYQGCWTPRFIGGTQRLSRHSWGIAADINFGNALDYSLGSPVHPILLNRMAEAGLVSGHRWVNADPGHFEYVGR